MGWAKVQKFTGPPLYMHNQSNEPGASHMESTSMSTSSQPCSDQCWVDAMLAHYIGRQWDCLGMMTLENVPCEYICEGLVLITSSVAR